jgi:hypothetical protein
MLTARAPSPTPQQVAPGVSLVTLGRGAAASNVYLVRSDSTWTLIDAGCAAIEAWADGIARELAHLSASRRGG